MNNKIVLENPLKSQEENTLIHNNFPIRVELNLQKYCVWSPLPKRGTIFVPSKTIYLQPETLENGNIVEQKITLAPNAQYGYPTVLTQEVWYAFQYLWYEQGRPKDGIIYFSRREIIVDILGKKYGEHQVQALEKAILQLAFTGLKFDYVFYNKEKDITVSEMKAFTLIGNVFLTTKEHKSDIVHDKCSVTINSNIVSNLLHGYYKPIFLSVVTSLKSDIAKLLYTKLDTHFTHFNNYEISTDRFFKEHGLEGKSYTRPGKRKQLLEKSIKELINVPTSSGAKSERYEFLKTANNKDWKLIVYSDGIQQKKKKRKEQKSQEIIEVKTESKVTTPQQEQTTQVISSDIQEVLTKFENIFRISNYKPNAQAITIIENLLKNHSIEVVKSWVYDAQQRCKETNYNPKTINGIKKFIEPYFTELEARKKREERERQQRLKERNEDQRFDHEKEYSQEYRSYISKRLEIIVELHPDKYLELIKLEKTQLSELEEKAKAASNRTSRKLARFHIEHFKKENNKLLRAVKFFQNTECSLPDFWEWDKKINPNNFEKWLSDARNKAKDKG